MTELHCNYNDVDSRHIANLCFKILKEVLATRSVESDGTSRKLKTIEFVGCESFSMSEKVNTRNDFKESLDVDIKLFEEGEDEGLSDEDEEQPEETDEEDETGNEKLAELRALLAGLLESKSE